MINQSISLCRSSSLYADLRDEALSMGVESLEENLKHLKLHEYEILDLEHPIDLNAAEFLDDEEPIDD